MLEPKLLAEGTLEAYRVMYTEKVTQLEIKEFLRDNVLRGRQIVLRLPLSGDGLTLTNSLNVTYQELTGATRPYSEFFDYVLGGLSGRAGAGQAPPNGVSSSVER